MVTLLSVAWRYHRVILMATQVLKFVADRINESSPEEREEIACHMRAIYGILRNVAKRGGDGDDLKPLTFSSLALTSGGTQANIGRNRRQRVRESASRIMEALKKYHRNLTKAELTEISGHLKEIRRLAVEIDRRVKDNEKTIR